MTAEAALKQRYGDVVAGPAPWNAVLDRLLSHRSVRAYRTDPLPPGTLEMLVAAAQSAASSSNLQLWSVVAVEDPERKARLSAVAASQKHIVQAPLFLVWLADLSRSQRVADVPLDGLPYLETFMVGIVDAALAAQNATVAAESLGLGTVYIGALRNNPEAVAAELGLPPGVFAVFGMCVGYPDEERPASVKPRLPQSVVLHREQYTIDAVAETDGVGMYDNHLEAFQREQAMAVVGWTKSVVSRLRNPGSLMGRDRMRAALGALGLELR
jgi:nitroreductase